MWRKLLSRFVSLVVFDNNRGFFGLWDFCVNFGVVFSNLSPLIFCKGSFWEREFVIVQQISLSLKMSDLGMWVLRWEFSSFKRLDYCLLMKILKSDALLFFDRENWFGNQPNKMVSKPENLKGKWHQTPILKRKLFNLFC